MKVMKRTVLLCVAMIGMVAMISQGMKLNVCAEEYVYDDLNRVIRVIYDDGGMVEYVYDSNGNIIKTIVWDAEKDSIMEEASQQPAGSEQENSSTNNALNGQKLHGDNKKEKHSAANTLSESGKEQIDTAYKNEQTEGFNADETLVQIENIEVYVQNIVKYITEYAKQTFKQQ